MRRLPVSPAIAWLAAGGLSLCLLLAACSSGADRGAAAREAAPGAGEVLVMDFADRPPRLDSLPPGWFHRTFWTRAPMAMTLGTHDGVQAIRLSTQASASMLMRAVDIDLQQYPLLAWRWFIEQPIDSTLDERTRAGDDHPARLFISFRSAGDYKVIGDFPHYVANGGNANVGRWHAEQIDLLGIHRKLWPDDGPARVTDIGLFCDSDDTGGASIAWFADVRMKRAALAK
jgi:hypothetical protein